MCIFFVYIQVWDNTTLQPCQSNVVTASFFYDWLTGNRRDMLPVLFLFVFMMVLDWWIMPAHLCYVRLPRKLMISSPFSMFSNTLGGPELFAFSSSSRLLCVCERPVGLYTLFGSLDLVMVIIETAR